MNLVELAQRIKAQRLEKKLTLEEWASRVDLKCRTLSKIENFRVTPSLPALGRIAKSLGTTVSKLVSGLDERQPRFVVVRKNEGKRVERDRPSSKIKYTDLAFKRGNKLMAPFLLDVPPGLARKEALPHEGEEFLMVTEGQVRLEYGDDVY
jgi:transcriptional regulator with XRE-family HTH domain